MKPAVFIIILIAILAAVGYFAFPFGENEPVGTDSDAPLEEPIGGAPVATESEFVSEELGITKVVYGSDATLDSTVLANDCRERGGVFNECGTICEPDAEACAAVCAFTCEVPLGN